MSTPMIDFEKLQDIIPEDGSITITIKRTANGKLAVLNQTKYGLVHLKDSFDSEVKDKVEAIKNAKQGLGKVVAFTETPAVLTATFEEKIKGLHAAETTLADAVNQYTEEVNKKIAELKEKKAAKSAAAKPPVKATAGQTGVKPPLRETVAPACTGKEDKECEQPSGKAAGTLFGQADAEGKEAA